MAGQQLFSFPILKHPEILQCLADIGITASEDELKNPTPLGVQRLYEQFLSYLLGNSARDYLQNALQPGFQVLQHLEYPDLHLEAVGALAFYRQLAKLLRRVGLDTFSVRDLIKPEALVLKRSLSALINFAKFREERIVLYDQLRDKTEELEDQRQLTFQRHQDLEARVNALRMVRAEQEADVQSARSRNAQLANQLRELNKRKQRLTEEMEEVKENRNKVAEEGTQLSATISAVKQECNRLKSRIVENPDRLKQTIAEMTSSLTSEKASVTAQERKLRDLTDRLAILTGAESDLAPCLAMLRDCEKEAVKRDEASKKVQEERERCERGTQALRDLGMKTNTMTRQLTSHQDRSTRFDRHAEQRRVAMVERLAALREERARVGEERDRAKRRAEEERRAAEEAEAKTADLFARHADEMAEVERQWAGVREQVEVYGRELLVGCAQVEGGLK